MRNKILILACILGLHTSAFSQLKRYTDGYIITEQGDTLKGKVFNSNTEGNDSKIRFVDEDGNKKRLEIKDVKAYQRGKAFYMKQVIIRPNAKYAKYVFMKVIVDGKLKLYQFFYDSPMMIPDGSGGMGADNIQKEAYYLEKEGTFTLVKKKGFKKAMAAYFSDHKELSQKIQQKELRYESMPHIVKVYNGETL